MPVAGVPITTWSTEPGAVVVTEIPASLECYFDAVTGTRTAAADVRAGIVPGRLPLPDPQAIENGRAALPQSIVPVVLAAGRALSRGDHRHRAHDRYSARLRANREPRPVPHYCRSGRLIHA